MPLFSGCPKYGDFAHYFYQEDKFNGKFHYLMKEPIYEGVGNHDNGSYGEVKNRNESYEGRRWMNAHKGPNYSWDWCGVRFFQLNAWPGNGKSHPDEDNKTCKNGCRINLNSFDSLDFLNSQLGDLQRKKIPYVVCFHVGFKNDSTGYNNSNWGECDKGVFYDVVKKYPPIYIFHGHIHTTGAETWKPKNAANDSPLLKSHYTAICNSSYTKVIKVTIHSKFVSNKEWDKVLQIEHITL